ncbi:MAG: carbamoyltransferase HypF, partial [Acidobacteria bacterium]|nr:carbamoyltransferase HypF [Acidobacteriota bacterium]
MGLTGWVCNTVDGVRLEVEGGKEILGRFQTRLQDEMPALATITSLESFYLDQSGFQHFEAFEGFEIRESESGGEPPGLVLPDIATCQDCLDEIFDPLNRRYRYPFTNCTNCGPRYSIIEDLPYDRHLTTMKGFRMCPACRAEYDDPADRRFHAQPNACPVCGPQLRLLGVGGVPRATLDAALEMAVDALRSGLIVAVKGIGGYHLMADAGNGEAIIELRRRKHRSEKPLALLYPDLPHLADLDEVRRDCHVSPLEERLLRSPEAPIVLLEQRGGVGPGRPLAELIAPGVSSFGVMLPSTPLHHLLLRRMGGPVVATSGNLADEPICTDDQEALTRLAG